ncbi:MAG: phage head-tail connector protein [Holosporales bacterium]|nr:phage head-tail connector protein [Holosporales bacterium]
MNTIIKHCSKQVVKTSLLKAHLRIDNDHEEEYLKEIIEIATNILEQNIEKSILKKAYRYIYFGSKLPSSERITLPLAQVKEVLSVKRLLIDKGKSLPIPYTTETFNEKTTIITNSSRYPTEIKYVAGITDKEDEIPKDLQFAILQIAKNIYECSEESILESSYVKHVIDSNRTLTIN